MLREIEARPVPGIPIALLLLIGTIAGFALLVQGARTDGPLMAIGGVLLAILCLILAPGLFTVTPNHGRVLSLFGDYKGTAKKEGLWLLRALTSSYPYDAHGTGEITLSTHTSEINKGLMEALHERFAKAGVEVIEARISHLAYAQEIAAAMLQRQQASAIVAARQTIVEGAVGMVEMALDALAQRSIVTLDDERKASMVSNLLVVLCSDRAAQPVVNTGTLYS